MSEKTYTHEEVVDMLTTLFKQLSEKFLSESSIFPWEQMCEPPLSTSSERFRSGVFGSNYAQVLSLIESTVEKDKVEPTKTIARQLLTATMQKVHTEQYNWFVDLINGCPPKDLNQPYKKMALILNK